MNDQKQMTSFQAPRDLVDQVRRLAGARERSVSAEIRRALARHVLLEQGDLELQELKEKADRFKPIGKD
jgi:predicted transcriptional regulator